VLRSYPFQGDRGHVLRLLAAIDDRQAELVDRRRLGDRLTRDRHHRPAAGRPGGVDPFVFDACGDPVGFTLPLPSACLLGSPRRPDRDEQAASGDAEGDDRDGDVGAFVR
jgi:hypothetical protein